MLPKEPPLATNADEDAERYHVLFQGSLDAIYVSSEAGEILRVNPAFLRLLGYGEEELARMSARDLYADPAERQRFQEKMRADGGVREFETALRHKDGSARTCLITATTRVNRAGALEYQGIIRDVTARRREQAELERASEALRRSNADLEQFAYVASHDLQEPLRKIRSFGDRLLKLSADRLDDRGADYLRRMISAAERMQALIDNLLDFSRVSSRGAPFQPVDLNTIIEDVLEDLRARIDEAGADIAVEELPVVQADPVQMRQLFQNLISNALKYRKPAGGPVRVRVGCRESGGPGAADESAPAWQERTAEISVEDNGIGFDPRYADRIFEVFQRLHSRSSYQGTGIGLGICRRIAQRHRGSIRAEGRPGEGATFHLTLPFEQVDGEP